MNTNSLFNISIQDLQVNNSDTIECCIIKVSANPNYQELFYLFQMLPEHLAMQLEERLSSY